MKTDRIHRIIYMYVDQPSIFILDLPSSLRSFDKGDERVLYTSHALTDYFFSYTCTVTVFTNKSAQILIKKLK